MSNISHIIHKNSSERNTGNNGPKIPDANDIEYGEIAINYDKGNETLFIKNNEDDIIEFVNKDNIIKKLPLEFIQTLINLFNSFEIKNNYNPQFQINMEDLYRQFNFEVASPPDPV
nr:MAG TPA: hypothetical protein [Caudoviricetes sp.]